MNIRKATQSDLPVMNEIYNQAVRQRYCTADLDEISIEQRTKWFKNHNLGRYPVFVMEEEGDVIGWIYFSPHRPGRRALQHTAEVSYYIHNDHQKKGIGTKLMEFAMGEAPKYNLRTLFALLLEPNQGSIKLLEKFNFEFWGRLHNVAEIEGKECNQVIYGRRV